MKNQTFSQDDRLKSSQLALLQTPWKPNQKKKKSVNSKRMETTAFDFSRLQSMWLAGRESWVLNENLRKLISKRAYWNIHKRFINCCHLVPWRGVRLGMKTGRQTEIPFKNPTSPYTSNSLLWTIRRQTYQILAKDERVIHCKRYFKKDSGMGA